MKEKFSAALVRFVTTGADYPTTFVVIGYEKRHSDVWQNSSGVRLSREKGIVIGETRTFEVQFNNFEGSSLDDDTGVVFASDL